MSEETLHHAYAHLTYITCSGEAPGGIRFRAHIPVYSSGENASLVFLESELREGIWKLQRPDPYVGGLEVIAAWKGIATRVRDFAPDEGQSKESLYKFLCGVVAYAVVEINVVGDDLGILSVSRNDCEPTDKGRDALRQIRNEIRRFIAKWHEEHSESIFGSLNSIGAGAPPPPSRFCWATPENPALWRVISHPFAIEELVERVGRPLWQLQYKGCPLEILRSISLRPPGLNFTRWWNARYGFDVGKYSPNKVVLYERLPLKSGGEPGLGVSGLWFSVPEVRSTVAFRVLSEFPQEWPGVSKLDLGSVAWYSQDWQVLRHETPESREWANELPRPKGDVPPAALQGLSHGVSWLLSVT